MKVEVTNVMKSWFQEHKKIWIGTLAGLLLVVGLIFTFNQQIANMLLENQTVTLAKPKLKANYNFGKVEKLTSAKVAQARMQKHNYIGVIAIPDINLNVPIVQGVANNDLAVGAGTMRPDMKMGKSNYALAGHNMDTTAPVLFSPIYQQYAKGSQTLMGKTIYISNLHKVYEYKIDNVMMVDPHQVGVVAPTKNPIITLVTCNYTGSQRVIVQGRLVKSYSYKLVTHNIKEILTQNVKND